MNVRTKLLGAFGLYIALLIVLSIYHVITTRSVVASGQQLDEIAARLQVTPQQLGRLTEMGSDAEKYLATHEGRDQYLAKFQRTMRDYDDELRRLASLQLSPKEHALLGPLTEQWRGAMALGSQIAAKPSQPRDVADAWMAQFQKSLNAVSAETQAFGEASLGAGKEKVDESQRSASDAKQATLVAAAGAVLLSLLLSWLLARSILKPLARLTEGTREVSAGRFGHRLATNGHDELAQVAREFNAMTERLDDLDRMKREFVSKVSHDLKTPLSSMQESNGVLLDGLAGPLTPKQRQLLEITQDSAKRLSAMLTKLLDLSRIEARAEGQAAVEQQTVDVRLLVGGAVKRVMEGSSVARLSLSTGEDPSALLVRGDADGLIQVFDNLLENAIKFSPFGGQVSVRLSDHPARGDVPPERWAALRRRGAAFGAVLVTVADEGPGVADVEKERVFERFYQSEAGRAVRGRGVGLGLAICQEIVTAHGGVIWVMDNEPHGAVFHVLLPAAARSGGGASAAQALAAEGVPRA